MSKNSQIQVYNTFSKEKCSNNSNIPHSKVSLIQKFNVILLKVIFTHFDVGINCWRINNDFTTWKTSMSLLTNYILNIQVLFYGFKLSSGYLNHLHHSLYTIKVLLYLGFYGCGFYSAIAFYWLYLRELKFASEATHSSNL